MENSVQRGHWPLQQVEIVNIFTRNVEYLNKKKKKSKAKHSNTITKKKTESNTSTCWLRVQALNKSEKVYKTTTGIPVFFPFRC